MIYPYGVTNCKWDCVIDFKLLWNEYDRVIKNNGAVVLFASQPFTTNLIYSNLKNFKYCWYWKKNNVTGALLSKIQPMRCIEDICVFYKKQCTYNPQGLIPLDVPKINKPDKSVIYRKKNKPSIQKYENYPKHFLQFKKDKSILHPTQKPVALLEYLIKTYTNENEVVLDNCMGSGSTGIACINTNRKFIGIELDNNYFNIAKNRIQNLKKEL